MLDESFRSNLHVKHIHEHIRNSVRNDSVVVSGEIKNTKNNRKQMEIRANLTLYCTTNLSKTDK